MEELQCEIVDMNDPTMDPLEWSVRRIIPIPKTYYWETGNYNISLKIKLWHRTIRSLGLTLKMAEKMGEVISNITGINSSRFAYITDHMTEEEWDEARKNAEEDAVRRKQQKEMSHNGCTDKDHSIQVV